MKAWLVREKGELCATVVFAETRGKARAEAQCTECCEGADFCNIEVHREPQMDQYYTAGKTSMDWDNPQDRLAIVKDCGFYCGYDAFDLAECKTCPAREYCDEYEYENKDEYEDENEYDKGMDNNG